MSRRMSVSTYFVLEFASVRKLFAGSSHSNEITSPPWLNAIPGSQREFEETIPKAEG